MGRQPFVLQDCSSLEEFPLSPTVPLWAHLQGHRPGVQLPCLPGCSLPPDSPQNLPTVNSSPCLPAATAHAPCVFLRLPAELLRAQWILLGNLSIHLSSLVFQDTPHPTKGQYSLHLLCFTQRETVAEAFPRTVPSVACGCQHLHRHALDTHTLTS